MNNKNALNHSSIVISTIILALIVLSLLSLWWFGINIVTIFAGAIIITLLLFFADHRYQLVTRRNPPLQRLDNDTVVVEGKASWYNGNRKIHGTLYLTNANILFNASTHQLMKLPLKDIEGVKLYYLFGIFHRGIIIRTKFSSEEKYILNYPRDWKHIINSYVGAA